MENVRFQSVWIFLLLPFLGYFLWQLLQGKKEARVRYSSLHAFKRLGLGTDAMAQKGLYVVRALAILFLVMALARPQTGKTMTEVETEAVDIILVLDASGSMRALDFFLNNERVTRLDAVKHVATEFINNRPNDRIGMVVFGQEAFTQCPQTLDHGVLLTFLQELEVGVAGDSTAIGSGIAVAAKRLKNLKSKSRVMILLTDGRNNAGSLQPMAAAEIAKALGIKIYTIGVGSMGKAPFLVNGFFGRQFVYQDVDLDEDTLRQIAQITDGRYFRATDTQSMKQIYGTIDRMEKTEVKVKQYLDYKEHFAQFLGLGLALLFTEIVLTNTKFRKIP